MWEHFIEFNRVINENDKTSILVNTICLLVLFSSAIVALCDRFNRHDHFPLCSVLVLHFIGFMSYDHFLLAVEGAYKIYNPGLVLLYIMSLMLLFSFRFFQGRQDLSLVDTLFIILMVVKIIGELFTWWCYGVLRLTWVTDLYLLFHLSINVTLTTVITLVVLYEMKRSLASGQITSST